MAGHRRPGSRQEPERDTVTEAEIIERAEALPDRYANRVRPQDLDGMRSMADGGEWQELVDVLIASLAMTQAPVTFRQIMARRHRALYLPVADYRSLVFQSSSSTRPRANL